MLSVRIGGVTAGEAGDEGGGVDEALGQRRRRQRTGVKFILSLIAGTWLAGIAWPGHRRLSALELVRLAQRLHLRGGLLGRLSDQGP